MNDFFFRRIPSPPKTFEDATNSVWTIAATEDPVRIWDAGQNNFVHEVLLLSGVELPKEGSVTLLDSHQYNSVSHVLGTATNFRPTQNGLECQIFFSGASPIAVETANKVKEGHLTDFSIGYSVIESEWLPEGSERIFSGKLYRGPIRITTQWRLKELSITPIGADPRARVRTSPPEITQRYVHNIAENLLEYSIALEQHRQAAQNTSAFPEQNDGQRAENPPVPAAQAPPEENVENQAKTMPQGSQDDSLKNVKILIICMMVIGMVLAYIIVNI